MAAAYKRKARSKTRRARRAARLLPVEPLPVPVPEQRPKPT